MFLCVIEFNVFSQVQVCMHVRVCECLWSLDINVGYLPLSWFTLFFWDSVFREMCTSLATLAGQQALKSSSSTSQHWDYRLAPPVMAPWVSSGIKNLGRRYFAHDLLSPQIMPSRLLMAFFSLVS